MVTFFGMAVYSINDIEQLTGIKAHTLRIWEKRYDMDFAHRTPTNVRYYLEEDLKNIMNISVLYNHGMKISKIAKMTNQEIRERVLQLTEVHKSHSTGLDALTLSLINLDQHSIDHIINLNTEQSGFSDVLENLIFPLFDKVNEMYLTGTIKPVHEGFLNNVLEGKLMVEIDRLRSTSDKKDPDYIIFQPYGSLEEISALILNYYLLEAGSYPLNIGNTTGFSDVIDAYNLHNVDHVIGLFNLEMQESEWKDYHVRLPEKLPSADLIFSGFWVYQQGLKSQGNITVMPDLNAILAYLEEMVPG
ncbi:MAG: MerR family transcriptional regulator [Saprospiraceae bacterium]|nr:MerR family transcriptional regulator [Saprospiraceae bacterium]